MSAPLYVTRLSALATRGCVDLGFAVTATGGFGSTAIWLVEHSRSNIELVNSRVFTGTIRDPTVSLDYCDVLYSTLPNSGATNYVSTVRTDDTSSADIAGSTADTTFNVSLQPSWHPNGQQVVFRGIETFPVLPSDPTVERCDRDGSNRIDLVPTVIGSSTALYEYPFYSDDGTKILFSQNTGVVPTVTRDIYTMDDDGTNVTLVASGAETGNGSIPIWIPGTTTVAYGKPSGGNRQIRTVEADGTGDALLYSDPETIASGAFFGLNPFSALPDGSGLVYAQYFPGDPANFNYRIGIIDTGSGTWTALSPTRVTAAFDFNINLPVVRGGRIWWDDGMSGSGGDGIVSVNFDGSDYTVEDNTSVFTQKWFA